MEKETNGLCHNIPWLCFWPTNWYRSLPIISDATHKATIASASSTLNPQRVLNKGRRKSGVVALLHPRSAKVRITYCTRMCTDRLHAHISALVSFTKSWLSPRRRAAWAGKLSISVACHVVSDCRIPYSWASTSKSIWRPRTWWQYCTNPHLHRVAQKLGHGVRLVNNIEKLLAQSNKTLHCSAWGRMAKIGRIQLPLVSRDVTLCGPKWKSYLLF